MRSTHYLLAAVLLTAPLHAQEPTLHTKPTPAAKPSDPTTLSLTAKLVNLPVVVYDKKGALIQTLTKDDFALSVDGHAQTIKYFDRDQDLPLTLGLLVDVSRSQSSVLGEERTASSSFIDQMLAPPAPPKKTDQAFVIQFGHSAELLGDMTDSKPKLQADIQQIDTDSATQQQTASSGTDPNDPNSPANTGGGRGGRGGGNGGYGGGRRGGGTVLYDAVYLSANELTSKQTGRKALILLTDGVDNGSKKTIGEAIEAAQRADTMIFSIYFKGEEHQDYSQNRGGQRGGGFPGGGGGGYPGRGGGGYPGGGGNGGGNGQPNGGNQPEHKPYVDGKKVLERMSEETGGRLFEVSRKQKVADIYKMIGDELRGEYRLGYIPDATTAAEGYHKVDLTIPKDKQAYIQTREGYYTGK